LYVKCIWYDLFMHATEWIELINQKSVRLDAYIFYWLCIQIQNNQWFSSIFHARLEFQILNSTKYSKTTSCHTFHFSSLDTQRNHMKMQPNQTRSSWPTHFLTRPAFIKMVGWLPLPWISLFEELAAHEERVVKSLKFLLKTLMLGLFGRLFNGKACNGWVEVMDFDSPSILIKR